MHIKNDLMKHSIKILAIETSCDETAAAVIGVEKDNPKILSNIVSSQIDLHAKTGGVVPEVASRAHVETIVPVITQALLDAEQKISKSEFLISNKNPNNQMKNNKYSEAIKLLQNEIDYIAYTAGPGLIGSLLVGYNVAKTIAYAGNLPIIPVNHIEGHIYSVFGREIRNPKSENSKHVSSFGIRASNFPLISLTVSGGHTSLTLMHDHGQYEKLGQTLDDAAGEAFDKVAKLLGLGYPGGPVISKLASEFRNKNQKFNQSTIQFPRPIINDGTFNFSFSGLKTAVLQKVLNIKKERKLTDNDKMEIAAAFEDAAVDVLVTKTLRAVKKYQPKTVILAGGVAANEFLRNSLAQTLSSKFPNLKLKIPDLKFCGDNAAMIGVAAYYHIKNNDTKTWNKVNVDSNLELI